MESTDEQTPEARDFIPLSTPGRSAIFEEPILDAIADKAARALREKPNSKITANDRAVLKILDEITPGELMKKGFLERTFQVCEDLDVTFRTLVLSQTEAVMHDTSKYQQRREIEKSTDGIERVVWQPTVEQIRTYNTKRVLAEATVAMGGQIIAGLPVKERLAFFEDMESTGMLNAVYRKLQQYFTAVALLFPSDNQKELLETLKKALAPRP